jgi:hypothetical protein
MYTSIVTIYDTPDYQIDSYGNGAAYCLRNKKGDSSIFIAGDDATTFRDSLEGYLEHHPNLEYNVVLEWMWDAYGS